MRSRWVRLSFRLNLCPCSCCKLRLGMAMLRSDIGSLEEPRPRFKPENEEQPAIVVVVIFMPIDHQSIVIIIMI